MYMQTGGNTKEEEEEEEEEDDPFPNPMQHKTQ